MGDVHTIAAAGRALGQGRYRLVDRLGSGGMAEVWRATDESLGVWRAIKLLHPHLSQNAGLLARFATEARTMARLRHPNLLAVHDVGDDDGAPWLVMDLLPGGSLADAVARHGHLPPAQAARLVASVLDGLAVAHAAGVVHRDVKPQNVLIDADGRPVLSDFGIARLTDTEQSLTRTGMALGTLAYMAPEQRTHARSVDAAADLYAAGATVVACVTGKEPYDLHVDTAFHEQTARFSPALAAVIAKAVRWAPEERYADAKAMAEALRAAVAGADEADAIDLVTEEHHAPTSTGAGATQAHWTGGTAAAANPLAAPAVIVPTPIAPAPPTAVPRAVRIVGVGLAIGLTVAVSAWGLGGRLQPAHPAATEVPVDLTRMPADTVLSADGTALLGVVDGRVLSRNLPGGDTIWPLVGTDVIEDFRVDPRDAGSVVARDGTGAIGRLARDGTWTPLGFAADAAIPSPVDDRLLVVRPGSMSIHADGAFRELRPFSPTERRGGYAWSTDGKAVAVVMHVPGARTLDTVLEVVDAERGRVIGTATLNQSRLPTSVTARGDEFLVATLDLDGEAHITAFPVRDGALGSPRKTTAPRLTERVRLSRAAAAHGDLTLLVTNTLDNDVYEWDGAVAHPVSADETLASTVGYADGRLLSVVTSLAGSRVTWPGSPLEAARDDVIQVTTTGDGLAWYELAGDTCRLMRWSPADAAPTHLFDTPRVQEGLVCPHIECTPTGFPCVTADLGAIVVIEADGAARRTSLLTGLAPTALSPDGREYATSGAGRLTVESLAGGTGRVVNTPGEFKIYDVEWQRDGTGWWLLGTLNLTRPALATLDDDGTLDVVWTGQRGDLGGQGLAVDPVSGRVAFDISRYRTSGALHTGPL